MKILLFNDIIKIMSLGVERDSNLNGPPPPKNDWVAVGEKRARDILQLTDRLYSEIPPLGELTAMYFHETFELATQEFRSAGAPEQQVCKMARDVLFGIVFYRMFDLFCTNGEKFDEQRGILIRRETELLYKCKDKILDYMAARSDCPKEFSLDDE